MMKAIRIGTAGLGVIFGCLLMSAAGLPSAAKAQGRSACDDIQTFCADHLGPRCQRYIDDRWRDIPARCAQQATYYQECREMARDYCSSGRRGDRGRWDGGRGDRQGGRADGWAEYRSITTQQAGAVRAGGRKDAYVAHPGGCMVIAGEAFEPGSALTIAWSDTYEPVARMTPDRNGRIKAQIDLQHAGYVAVVETSRGSSFRYLIGATPDRCRTRGVN